MLTPKYPRILKDRDNYRKWYLDEDTEIHLPNGDTMTIPKGYRFDAHSVPFIFRWIFPKKQGDDIYAAMVHDYLIDVEMFLRYNRKFQDNIYRLIMESPAYKTSNFRSFWMPKAVRFFGWLNFDIWGDFRGVNKHRKKLEIKLIKL